MQTISTAETAVSGAAEAHTLVASDRVDGTAVRRANGETVGTVHRMMIDKVSGRVAYVVLDAGGLFGIGEQHYALPWSALRYDPSLGAYVTRVTDDQLRDAPRGIPGEDPSADPAWEEHVHHYFNQPAFSDETVQKASHEAKG